MEIWTKAPQSDLKLTIYSLFSVIRLFVFLFEESKNKKGKITKERKWTFWKLYGVIFLPTCHKTELIWSRFGTDALQKEHLNPVMTCCHYHVLAFWFKSLSVSTFMNIRSTVAVSVQLLMMDVLACNTLLTRPEQLNWCFLERTSYRPTHKEWSGCI